MKSKEKKALELAKKVHQGQFYGKKPYTFHLLKVYKLLKTVTKDEDILCAALLHDCIEDSKVDYNQIKKEFGQRVADLVKEVTKDKSRVKEGEFHIKTKDAFIIKLADMLHNLSGDKKGYFEKKVRSMKQICCELIEKR